MQEEKPYYKQNRILPTLVGMDDVRQLILNRASELKMPLSELSLKIGRNHAYLQQFIKRGVPRDLPEKVRPQLASELRVPENSLRGTETKVSPIASNLDYPDRHKNVIKANGGQFLLEEIPSGQLLGDHDLPVFAIAQDDRGASVLSSNPVAWVVRPEPLARVKDGYGVIVTEDSMAPEFRSGDTALVNPHMPPRDGDTCIFRSLQRDGSILACIKYLRRATADAWHVTEWHDPKGKKRDFSLKKADWQTCHVTVGAYKRR